MPTKGRVFVRLALALLLASCSRQNPPPPVSPLVSVAPAPVDHLTLTEVDFTQLPGWQTDHLTEAVPALRRSCDHLMQLPSDRVVGNDGVAGTAGDWTAACGALRWLKQGDEAALRDYLRTWYHVVKVGNGHGDDGRFTGYFEAELHGSRQASARYKYPLLARPEGQSANPPADSCCSRAEIEAGALAGRATPLLWVDDAVDAHILHIQGSGRILLEDGTLLRVGFAGSNGRNFVGLGKILAAHGKIPEKSTMPAIRAWLKAHPGEAPALMAENPRYVFFRLVQGDGPVGALNVVLTPGRSLAVDPHFLPLGAPVWLDTVDPDGARLQRLMVAQDIGKAIEGAVRGDIYWGTGEAAFDKAGRMNSRGSYYLLLPQRHSSPLASLFR